MAQKFLTDILMGLGTSILNLVVDPRSSAPSNPAAGQVYYNTTDKVLYYYNGTVWKSFGAILEILTPSGSALSSTNNQGAITLQVQVDSSTLEIVANSLQVKDGGITFAKLASSVYTDTISGNASDVLTTENAVKSYVDATVASIGNLKGGFDAVNETQMPVSASGTKKGDYWYATSNGVVLTVPFKIGDVLIANKNNPSRTNINDWIYLQHNVDLATESIPGIARIATQTEVTEGTNNTAIVTSWRLKQLLDSLVNGMTVRVGNGVDTSFVITHNFSTKYIVVQIVEDATGETVHADVERTSNNTITVRFNTAPTTEQFRILVKK